MKSRHINALKTWLKLWPEIWATPVSIGILLGSYYVIYAVDETIGTFDIGTLQALLFTSVVLVVLNTITFLGIEFNDKRLWKYYKDKYEIDGKPNVEHTDESDFENLTPWQRTKILYCWRAFLLSLGAVVFLSLT